MQEPVPFTVDNQPEQTTYPTEYSQLVQRIDAALVETAQAA